MGKVDWSAEKISHENDAEILKIMKSKRDLEKVQKTQPKKYKCMHCNNKLYKMDVIGRDIIFDGFKYKTLCSPCFRFIAQSISRSITNPK